MYIDFISLSLGISVIEDNEILKYIYDKNQYEKRSHKVPGPNTGLGFSAEHKKNISKSRIGRIWIYDPISLNEKWIFPNKIDLYINWLEGRSPKTKHGGARGEYNKERWEKAGIKKWIEVNGKPGLTAMLGKKHSEETKQKMRESHKKRKNNHL